MTSEQILQLKELLTLMATTSEENRPAGFIPDKCLLEFYKATVTPFVELVIYRERGGRFEYLYQNRLDQWWNGFSAFGGMVRNNQPASPLEVAQGLIDREFKGEGLAVEALQVVSFLRWPKHPWCNPLAILCLIRIIGNIPDREGRAWFSVDSLPREEEMVMNHGLYLLQCEHFLRTGKPLLFTPTALDGLSY